MTNLRLQHDLGTSITLGDPARNAPLWQYVYSGKPKPFFHPLCTPAGHCLSLFEPHDHVWHRGLWFTIKFVNGSNFWEEGDIQGIQKTLRPPAVTHQDEGRFTVSSRIDWVDPSSAVVIREERSFSWQPFADDAYLIDFNTQLTPQVDVLLDRTPFTTWGGYGGLILRGTRNWQNTRLLFSDNTTSDRPTGHPALWCDLSGKIDGGKDQTGGVAMFDHPGNVRHPSPWYGATGAGHYFNAAFLFHEPLTRKAGDTLAFRYGVLVHDNLWDHARLSDAYQRYISNA